MQSIIRRSLNEIKCSERSYVTDVKESVISPNVVGFFAGTFLKWSFDWTGIIPLLMVLYDWTQVAAEGAF